MQKSQVTEIPTQLQDFEDFAHSTMKDWKIQGLAIAIIRDDEVITAKKKTT